jgi:hypothetical protein
MAVNLCVHKIFQHLPWQSPPKINPNCGFWSENVPSGNPASYQHVQLLVGGGLSKFGVVFGFEDQVAGGASLKPRSNPAIVSYNDTSSLVRFEKILL